MALDELMGLTNRLLAQALALAAVSARLRLDELGTEGDPAVRAQLDEVVDVLGVREHIEALTPGERAVVFAFARSYLAQGLELVDDPSRPGAWTHDDPVLLQAQGSASAVVATLLSELGLAPPGTRFLDIGTGVGGIATRFCELVPDSSVVGIDPWRPALELARKNVEAAGLASRVTLLETGIEDLVDEDGFDLAWLPTFFIPEAVLGDAIRRLRELLLRPQGRVVVGVTFADASDALVAATDDLMTVRSGGSVLEPADAQEQLERAGFADVHEIERTWQAPLRFVVGTRP